MKRLLFGFFQVICLLHLLGGNLYAHPVNEHHSPFQLLHHHTSSAGFNTLQNEPVVKITSQTPRSRKIVGLITENIEEEYEPFSCKKQLEAGDCFTTIFYSRLPEHLHHNNKNHLAFRKQSSFIHPNSKQIVFQVFRI